jgi:hypothetical protein
MLSCARHSMSMAVIGTLALLPAAAQAGQIWFAGMDPVTTADRERVGQDPPGTYAGNDFMDLFRPNAPWTRTASIFRQAFPSAQFCDAEPIAFPLSGGWTSTILQWTKTFQSATGVPLACFQADVQWTGPWQQQLSELKTRLHGAGIKLGVMYTGNGNARTGLEWVQQSVQRARAVEANPATAPDQALLQSWMRQPDHMLPETQPGTMTNLVLEYAQRRK